LKHLWEDRKNFHWKVSLKSSDQTLGIVWNVNDNSLIIEHNSNPRKENLNLLDWIKFLNLFLYTVETRYLEVHETVQKFWVIRLKGSSSKQKL
jgi:hypothetical protein